MFRLDFYDHMDLLFLSSVTTLHFKYYALLNKCVYTFYWQLKSDMKCFESLQHDQKYLLKNVPVL
jgi:hypothetical protein